MNRIYTYKEYLIRLYGDKTYKLPIHIPVTCPNRDGTKGKGGCWFCSEQGTGFESEDSMTPISKQLSIAKEKVVKRYKAKHFIGYFQNYTNTYLPLSRLMEYLEEAKSFGLSGIDIATRPDTVEDAYLGAIREFSEASGLHVTFEIGLQIANDEALERINRRHTVADYVDAVKRIKDHGFSVCTHLILNLPGTTMEDVLTTCRLMNELEMDIVKLHSLYISKDSVFGRMYLEGELTICTMDEYVERVVTFILHLRKDTAISRVVSRIPEDDALFSNWGNSWWKVYNAIMKTLEDKDLTQGMKANE